MTLFISGGGEPRPEAAYPPLPWFGNIGNKMVYSTIRRQWANHYARAIENQLDVVHLPFVHHNTIGRGNRGPGQRTCRKGDQDCRG